MPYDLRTELVGIVSIHEDVCPSRRGESCRCGPLGYRAGVWNWDEARWDVSPLLGSMVEAREWQRVANRPPAARPLQRIEEKAADPAEKLFWWAFCYVGLAFVGVAVALFASDVVH